MPIPTPGGGDHPACPDVTAERRDNGREAGETHSPDGAGRISSPARHVLRLYITGANPAAVDAVRVVRAVCDDVLPARHDLEVIDVHHHPERAVEENVPAVPMLVREYPLPRQAVVGHLSVRARVLECLQPAPDSGF
jgi:circadian clock protein KaiB